MPSSESSGDTRRARGDRQRVIPGGDQTIDTEKYVNIFLHMDDMGAVFDALGSATRRRILDIVKDHPGCTVGMVAGQFDTTRIAVMHHIRMLEEAQLVISQKDGRKRRLYHNAVPIQMIYDRWTTEYSALWASRMADVKYRVEHPGEEHEHGGHGEADLEGSDTGPHRGRVA